MESIFNDDFFEIVLGLQGKVDDLDAGLIARNDQIGVGAFDVELGLEILQEFQHLLFFLFLVSLVFHLLQHESRVDCGAFKKVL